VFGTYKNGRGIALRLPAEADRQLYLALCRESQEFHAPWSPSPPPEEPAHTDASFDRLLDMACTERRRGFLITRISDGTLVGAVNLNEISRGPLQSCYVGYWIGASFARQGLMTKALYLAVRCAFEDLGLHRVEANIVPENAASLALVRRLGFRREGLARRYLQIAGSWRDHERWAITVEDTLLPPR